jgi:hypothetical protein
MLNFAVINLIIKIFLYGDYKTYKRASVMYTRLTVGWAKTKQSSQIGAPIKYSSFMKRLCK